MARYFQKKQKVFVLIFVRWLKRKQKEKKLRLQLSLLHTFYSLQVESLTAARTAAMKGTEPSDAIRVVNALLTQIDQIKKYKVLIHLKKKQPLTVVY